MSWEAGVDVSGTTGSGVAMPNVIVHVARRVHTPVGSAAAGMVLYQPDPGVAPTVMGFVSSDERVGRYFGPHLFAGTPFEDAPVLAATVDVAATPTGVRSTLKVAGITFEVSLEELGALNLIQRAPEGMAPFNQQGLESTAMRATLRVDGQPVALTLPVTGVTGGPSAVWTPAGIYAR